MLARFQAGKGLAGVHLRGVHRDHGVHFPDGQAVLQPGGDVGMPHCRPLPGLGQVAADEGDDPHIGMF